MLRRRMLQAGIAIGVLAASVFGSSSAANASPASFVAKAVHAGGAGAVAVQATGGLAWYSRSVTVTSLRVYVKAGECGKISVFGSQGNTVVDAKGWDRCGTGTWETIGNVTLDGSAVSGGITDVTIYVRDLDHEIVGYADCYRVNSSCSTGQY
ncbi:hypothetical protein AB0J72_48955 [Dactylosporangium sp. NPDC049742]|uniref:hypothetical protein n=1 Tax=Dactylosporangium sp. NPDC049742 TaxID=3154737 RepID=UPI0034259926